uniref:Uncharacterized protein n=1 Tax=Candidatus Kentrum sp. UNK TaxID=2126344 RepID=A0A451ACM6_9GAMM|nr:MAG: hypothetical protein BECKUNK1418G_GA0071005_103624 [Candidatus Kentron sp. UNK]VFK70939.1 MAG: hypothetical protein BECKUNK1418H_GA0071006_104325 [Candidatus Kentron sp. UNK]
MFVAMKQLNKRHVITVSWLAYILVFGILATVYQFVYTTYYAVPRADPPWLGWWGWVDQGLYLKSSVALAQGNFSPSEHFYMPLYPFVGSLLMAVAPQHSYWLPNLLLMLGFAVLFFVLASRYIGTWPAAVTLLAGMVLFEPLRLQWVIPWTSTLSAFLMMAAFFLLDRYLRFRETTGWPLRTATLNAVFFGFTLGALAATRTVDLAVMMPVALTYAFFVLRDLLLLSEKRLQSLAAAVAGLVGFLIPFLGWLAFNNAVYGAFFGGHYFNAAESIGFFPSTLPVKIYSQLLDSFTLHGEADQDWLSRLPLFALSLAFLPALFVLRVPLVFRVAAIVIAIQFAIYYSFADIVPTGTFRFFNIHYFKWMMPLLLGSAVVVLRQGISREGIKHWRGRVAMSTVAFMILTASAVGMGQYTVPVSVIEQSERRAVFSLPGEGLDFIDIPATNNNWNAIYFSDHFSKGFSVMLGGKRLRQPRDYHPYPIPGGMRLLFVRPITGNSLILDVGTELHFTKPLDGLAEGVAVGFLPIWRVPENRFPIVPPSRLLTFHLGGNAGEYIGKGWSGGHKSARWINGEKADIRMRLLERPKDDLLLALKAGGFIAPPAHPETMTEVFANHCLIGRLRFTTSDLQDHLLRLPAPCVEATGNLRLEFRNLSPESPRNLGINDDERKLGLALVSIILKEDVSCDASRF